MSSIRISKEIDWPYVFNILKNKYDFLVSFLNTNTTEFIKSLRMEELFNKKYVDMLPPKNLKTDIHNIQLKLNTLQNMLYKKHNIVVKNKSALLNMVKFIYENYIYGKEHLNLVNTF